MSDYKIVAVDYHRNGSSGNGFHVVLFTEGRGTDRDTKIATVFPEPGNIAILSITMMAQGKIGDGQNRWRAEDYEKEMREAIRQWTIRTYGYDPDRDDKPETEPEEA